MNRIVLHNGKWIPRITPLRVFHRPLPPALPLPPPPPSTFDTLATLPTSSSLQAPVPDEGPRTGAPNAAAVPVAVQDVPGSSVNKSFLGVQLPLKPVPPAEGECCMSGCAHCVYDLYLEDVEHFHSVVSDARTAILNKIDSQGLTVDEKDWPEVLGPLDDDHGGDASAKQKAEKELAKTKSTLEPALRAFLEMEARMKKKQADREAAAAAATAVAA